MAIQTGSKWVNNKTQDIYTVWCVAKDLNSVEYVIYSKKPFCNKCGFLVRHSENLVIGKCELLPGDVKFDWVVEFEDKLNDSHGIKIDVWARPLELWESKFALVKV